MLLGELRSVLDNCVTDAEFLAHPEVRRAYWRIMEPDREMFIEHDWYEISKGFRRCLRCGVVKCADPENHQNRGCTFVPDIPGSLADAAEVLRAKVADIWFRDVIDATTAPFLRRWRDLIGEHQQLALDTARERFLVFAAALGAVEV